MFVSAGWARRIRTIVASLLVIVTAALCAANVRLCVPAVVGCRYALTVWRLRLLVELTRRPTSRCPRTTAASPT
jgi:hypothetical protein